MRKLLACFIFTTTLVYGQTEKSFPFQVIDAKGAYGDKGRLVKRYDLLSKKDKINLKNGHIFLVHYTGLPFSFKGDTVIFLQALHEKIIKSSKKIADVRPDIKKLFSSEPHNIGAIMDYTPLFVYPPPRTTLSHNEQDDLCLSWETGKGNYRVDLKNMFEDSLQTYYADTNHLTIPAKVFKDLRPESNILLIFITIDNLQRSSLKCTIIRNTQIDGLFQCDLDAHKALLVGYYMEMAGKFDAAESYYIVATSLSEDEVFDEVLAQFKKRKK